MRSNEISEATDLKNAVLSQYPRHAKDSRFDFRCHPGIDCFNVCCADVNIVLTPYDVLRLRKRLGLGSRAFLDAHTVQPFTPEQRLPIVLLRMQDDERKSCPFVGPSGCRVYEDRPWPCRMYPVGIASSKTRARPEGEEFYFLLHEEHCHGCREGRSWTIGAWLDSQGTGPYDTMGDAFKELTLHPRLLDGPLLEPRKIDMFFMACYDLDSFRRFVLESRFLDKFEVDPARVDALKTDDEALLRFGFEWLRFALAGELTMAIRPEAVEAAERKAAAKP